MRISDWSSDVCSSDLEPADHVGGTGLAQQDLADLLQHRIAGSMAIAIVDGLEVVHIEVEHRAGSAVAFLESGHAAELADEGAAVQPRSQGILELQRVVWGKRGSVRVSPGWRRKIKKK